jgi:hypothetical protein
LLTYSFCEKYLALAITDNNADISAKTVFINHYFVPVMGNDASFYCSIVLGYRQFSLEPPLVDRYPFNHSHNSGLINGYSNL